MVVIVGAVPAGGAVSITIESAFVASGAVPFAALTVKLNVPSVDGIPEMMPLVERAKPPGRLPLSRLHVIGIEPVAARVWLYAVPT